MPDNIEYAYMGYAAALIGLGGLVAWIYLRFVALRRDAREVEQIEAEVRNERAASGNPSRAGEPAPTPQSATAVPKET